MPRYWITLLLAAVPLLASEQPNLPAPTPALLGAVATAKGAMDGSNQEFLPDAVELKPNLSQQTFHVSGNSQDLITQVCIAYGITASLDESIASRSVRLDLDHATWPEAIRVITRLTKTFWTPFSAHQALIAADTEGNRRNLERSILRTFYFSESTTPQTLNDIAGALRATFELRSVTTDVNAGSISVRADAETIEAVIRLLHGLKNLQPQVELNVDIFQVSGSFTRSFGVTVPTDFQIFYLPTGATAALIAQSISSSATLDNLSIGTRQLGLTIPPASFGISQSQSNIRTIDQVTLRAAQGEPAVLKIGERYPILTSTYTSATTGQAFQSPTFNYVDIGLTLKATTNIHRDGTVGVKLELQQSALGPQSSNGMPVILNSEFNGFVSAKDGEPIVAAGNIMKSMSRTRSGWPALAAIPGLSNAFSNASTQLSDDELIIVITPHIVSSSGSDNPGPFLIRPGR